MRQISHQWTNLKNKTGSLFRSSGIGGRKAIFFICHLFFLFSFVAFPSAADQNSTILIALYASGGTLEQELGLITDDFKQVVKGAENLSETIDILAAYGGADKPGWHGMTIANLTDLRIDLEDGELGNTSAYQIYYPDANMGDPQILSLFLSYISENYPSNRTFLIFIGHGQAYTGMLFDQNHDEDGLTIGELSESFGTGPWDIDLIGFDSCLMGCLEVLSGLSPYASYIIASEEAEPAEGWPYEQWISYISSHPHASVEEYAFTLAEEYMKNPRPGKTIALLDPKMADFLTAQLDQFAKDLHALAGTTEGCLSIRIALENTQQFGLTGTGELEEATMDLYSFADNIQKQTHYLSASASGVRDGINKTVLFSRHDEHIPGAYGIAVLSPVLIHPVFYEYYRESAFITPSWDRFIIRYLSCPKDEDLVLLSPEKERDTET